MDSHSLLAPLLHDLYTGLHDDAAFTDFIQNLTQGTHSTLGAVLIQDLSNHRANSLHPFGVDSDTLTRYETEFAAENLWFKRTRAITKPGAVLVSDDWTPLKDLHASRYHADFLRHVDVEHSVGICGHMQIDSGAFITLCRSRSAGPFDVDARALFDLIAPHWVNASSLRNRLFQMEREREALDAMTTGTFFADARGRLLHTNAAGERMLASNWLLRMQDGQLNAGTLADRKHFQHCLQGILSGHVLAAEKAVLLHDTQGMPVGFASFHRLSRTQQLMPSAQQEAKLAVFVHPVHVQSPLQLEACLMELYALTAAESRFVAVLHATGSLEATAIETEVTLGSARTRLQRTMEKMSVNRQSALLRLVDALARR